MATGTAAGSRTGEFVVVRGVRVTSPDWQLRPSEACTREGAGRAPNSEGPQEDGGPGRLCGVSHASSMVEWKTDIPHSQTVLGTARKGRSK